MIRLVQLFHPARARAIATVNEGHLNVLGNAATVYGLAQLALLSSSSLVSTVQSLPVIEQIPYDDVYWGRSEWVILPAIDHPTDPVHLTITGTGLTHKASADNRAAMHAAGAQLTDSMRMYNWGLEGGRPAPGTPGTSPEWFYKGPGDLLRAHGRPLEVPDFGEDGGDEGEIAGVYIISPAGVPLRIGMAQGNEFSDHIIEKKNYLYLASSKMRQCSLGPELVIEPQFSAVKGVVRIHRGEQVIWEKVVQSGEENMCHSLENMEHHHFKFPHHRKPGDLHVHFFGASAFSFGDKMKLQHGDVMEVAYEGFGRPLLNSIAIHGGPEKFVKVNSL
jgi:hypothetical protein